METSLFSRMIEIFVDPSMKKFKMLYNTLSNCFDEVAKSYDYRKSKTKQNKNILEEVLLKSVFSLRVLLSPRKLSRHIRTRAKPRTQPTWGVQYQEPPNSTQSIWTIQKYRPFPVTTSKALKKQVTFARPKGGKISRVLLPKYIPFG